jgi:hypothetical protein
MSRKIDSEMMKRAVEQLFNHEVANNGKCSSHSQLERWIIEELKAYTPSDSPVSLKMVLMDIRRLSFEIDVKTNDDDDVKEVPLAQLIATWYDCHGFKLVGTGGGCDAFQKMFDDDSYLMVTERGGCNIPVHSTAPVSLGMYVDDNPDTIFYKEFDSSNQMFEDEIFKALSGCRTVHKNS